MRSGTAIDSLPDNNKVTPMLKKGQGRPPLNPWRDEIRISLPLFFRSPRQKELHHALPCGFPFLTDPGFGKKRSTQDKPQPPTRASRWRLTSIRAEQRAPAFPACRTVFQNTLC